MTDAEHRNIFRPVAILANGRGPCQYSTISRSDTITTCMSLARPTTR